MSTRSSVSRAHLSPHTYTAGVEWCGIGQQELKRRPSQLVDQSVDTCLLVGCLTSQQHAVVSQDRICSDNFTCCHTEIEVADQTFHLAQSQYTDTGPTSPITDPITPGAWQGSHWSTNFEVTGMTRPRKKSRRKRDSNPGSSALEADALTTRPTRRWRGVRQDPCIHTVKVTGPGCRWPDCCFEFTVTSYLIDRPQ